MEARSLRSRSSRVRETHHNRSRTVRFTHPTDFAGGAMRGCKTALRPNPETRALPSLDTADELPGAIAAVILDEDG